MLEFLTLTLASLALAVTADKTCFSESKYSLEMFLSDAVAPLYALDSGPAGTIILVADPELVHPGTPIYETGAAPNTALLLDLSDAEPLSSQTGSFSLSVPDMGERYGSAAPVLGSEGFEWPHWYTTSDMVWPQQTSGAQVFFACDTVINGHKYVALSWGLSGSDGSMPAGCYGTIVGKRYDVQVPC